MFARFGHRKFGFPPAALSPHAAGRISGFGLPVSFQLSAFCFLLCLLRFVTPVTALLRLCYRSNPKITQCFQWLLRCYGSGVLYTLPWFLPSPLKPAPSC